MKRLISLDHLRGFAIVSVIFYHTSIFNTMPSTPGSGVPTDPVLLGIYWFMLYFVAWAGMFAIVSGTSNTISLYGGLKSGKVKNPKQLLVSSVFSGGIVIVINYVYLYLFSPGFVMDEVLSGGFLPCLIRYGQIYPKAPNPLFSTALIMIGWSILISGVVLYFLMRNDGIKKTKRNYTVIFTLATLLVFVIYPIVHSLTYDYLQYYKDLPLTAEDFLPRLLLHWLVGAMDPILPYAGFALYGVIFGMFFVDYETPKRQVLSYGYGMGIIVTVVGIVLCVLNNRYVIPPYDVVPFPEILTMLGPMFIFFTVWVHRVDLRGDGPKIRAVKRIKTARRAGVVSLTGFLLEGSVAQLLRRVVILVYPAFDTDILFILFVFPTIVLIVWIFILKYWERVDFKYSFEWMLIAFARKVTHKESLRLGSVRKIESYVDVQEKPQVQEKTQ